MTRYLQIGDERYLSDVTEDGSSEADVDTVQWGILQKTYRTSRKTSWLILGGLWILSIILTAMVAVFLTLKSRARDPLGTLASGYASDFGPAIVAASSVQRTFTGSPLFDDVHGEYIPSDSPSMKYIGSGPAVDKAWRELSQNRYFLLTDEEAKEAWGEGYTEFWNDEFGGYAGGLDMFHTLHCLDHLRMSFYPDKYVFDELHGDMHQIHCVDHLRQMIQCNSDMTVIPTVWYESIGQNYINSDRTHTCRDFTKVREWATSRFTGDLEVMPRYRNGTPWENYHHRNDSS
ncbi:hypothetical protein F5Y16DRAFT_409571 [Xylariaceae sp. FL0255]|nr:hypothetical protein F5Y16DRAFT_409571 [Xylariaceae sp. FL0255]